MSTVIVTGSAGLVGSACVKWFRKKGHHLVGIDNGARSAYFGEGACTNDTGGVLYGRDCHVHNRIDVSDKQAVDRLFRNYGDSVKVVVHAAAQPSHDWAANRPHVDFETNALGTLNILEATRQYLPKAAFIFTSTNKVYGDRPNNLPLVETETRYSHDHAIGEDMSVDQTTHSLFGCSKLAADVMVQEYGRYFGMNTVCFRCGCITGPNHAGVKQHGFLSYLVKCAVRGEKYTMIGHKGKQVRDNIHADDLVSAFVEYLNAPKPGAVYNIGGGRERSCSVREAIAAVERIGGLKMDVDYEETARKGDHIWWITDNSKFERDYPGWQQRYTLDETIKEMIDAERARAAERIAV